MRNYRTISPRGKWVAVLSVAALHPILLYLGHPLVGDAINTVFLAAPVIATLLFNWWVGSIFILVNSITTGFVFVDLTAMTAEDGIPRAVVSILVTVGVCIGADRLRKYIEQRKEIEQALRQSKKMEAMGRLAGGVAHDINNTLNAIMGSAFALRHELSTLGRPFKDLDNIVSACDQGAQLTRSLLGFSRKSPYITQIFSLNTVVEDVGGLLERTAHKNIKIISHLEDDPPLMEGDRAQIENAVMNLCLNSLDAMKDTGILSISTYQDKSQVAVSVVDTGPGMDEAVKEHVFEPFFTTKPPGEGTGLGLSMVYGVVRGMKGEITLDSTKEKGTAVTLKFPRVEAPDPEQRDSGIVSDNNDGLGFLRGRTILLIDDEPLVLRATIRMLKTLGCDVLSATNGAEGIEIFKGQYNAVSLAIVDLIMPDMDGAATLSKLREIDENIPVLLVSGYTREADKMESLKGVNTNLGFLSKPFQAAQLITAAIELLEPQEESDRPSQAG